MGIQMRLSTEPQTAEVSLPSHCQDTARKKSRSFG